MAAHLYAMMTEDEVIITLKQLCGIDIEKASLARLVQTVGQPYLPTHIKTGAPKYSACETERPLGIVGQRIKDISEHPDRDRIIQDAVDGKIEGASSSNPAKLTIVYCSSDGTGVPGLKRELSEKGKNGGHAQTFEAKVGVVFKQEFDSNGLPVLNKDGDIHRIPETTQYTATVEKVDPFSRQMADFLATNMIASAPQAVFLSDGANWLSNLPERIFPAHVPVIMIIDKFHAIEHLNDLVDKLFFSKAALREKFRAEARLLLDLGKIQDMATLIRKKASSMNLVKKVKIDKDLEYFIKNEEKMRYGLFQTAGLFVGSGVVEAACKTVVGKRLKNAGMHWSKKGAAIAIALRCAIMSGRFDYCHSEFNLAAA
ncbi:MAG: hypothetical protein LBI12_02315 [Treponema sp.]|nr:hypothetical protein [Treponema sp.]